MANMQFSITPATPTIDAATSANWSTSYPASYSLDLTRPRRVARTTNTTVPKIVYDFGSATAIAAVSCENFNWTDCTIKGGTTSSTVDNTQNFTFSTVDPEDNRMKFLCVLAGWNYRYMSIAPIATPGGISYFEIGGVGIWKTLVTMNKNFSTPYEKTQGDNAPRIEFDTGGLEVGVPTPITIEFSLQGRFPRSNTTAFGEYNNLGTYARNKVMLIYENQADLRKMYHVRRSGSFRITRPDNGTFTISGIQFTEVA